MHYKSEIIEIPWFICSSPFIGSRTYVQVDVRLKHPFIYKTSSNLIYFRPISYIHVQEPNKSDQQEDTDEDMGALGRNPGAIIWFLLITTARIRWMDDLMLFAWPLEYSDVAQF